jgi:hypothetical protein
MQCACVVAQQVTVQSRRAEPANLRVGRSGSALEPRSIAITQVQYFSSRLNCNAGTVPVALRTGQCDVRHKCRRTDSGAIGMHRFLKNAALSEAAAVCRVALWSPYLGFLQPFNPFVQEPPFTEERHGKTNVRAFAS